MLVLHFVVLCMVLAVACRIYLCDVVNLLIYYHAIANDAISHAWLLQSQNKAMLCSIGHVCFTNVIPVQMLCIQATFSCIKSNLLMHFILLRQSRPMIGDYYSLLHLHLYGLNLPETYWVSLVEIVLYARMWMITVLFTATCNCCVSLKHKFSLKKYVWVLYMLSYVLKAMP